jgi:hypothetical protein
MIAGAAWRLPRARMRTAEMSPSARTPRAKTSLPPASTIASRSATAAALLKRSSTEAIRTL